MSGEESMPITSASGNRSISSSVELPGHAPRRLQWHLRQQIARRARALILEFEVLPGGPVGGGLVCVVGHQRENFLSDISQILERRHAATRKSRRGKQTWSSR
jgi:hypothetical protein